MNIINTIYLSELELKTFTEQDALDYCQLNSINYSDITELYLRNNELTDISGIKLFKNLKDLNLAYNKIKDISVLKKLKELSINNNQIKDISVIQYLTDLKILYLNGNRISNISVLKNLNIKYIL